MRSKFWMVLAGLMVVAAPLAAQEREAVADDQEQEEARPEPVFRLKVLENPYDISSFYRSSGSGGGFLEEGEGRGGNAYHDPYSIAGYYRGGSRGGYSYGPGRGELRLQPVLGQRVLGPVAWDELPPAHRRERRPVLLRAGHPGAGRTPQ
jgi:hypothetical protein